MSKILTSMRDERRYVNPIRDRLLRPYGYPSARERLEPAPQHRVLLRAVQHAAVRDLFEPRDAGGGLVHARCRWLPGALGVAGSRRVHRSVGRAEVRP